MNDNEYHIYEDRRKNLFKKHKLFWHKTNVSNFYMPKKWVQDVNNIDKLVLKGWLPNKPFIKKEHIITAFGSCFARALTEYLQSKGYIIGKNIFAEIKKDKSELQTLREKDAHIITYSSDMNNTFTVRQQFEWAFENRKFNDKLWYDDTGNFVGYSSDIQESTRKIFELTDVFIITLGLSEIWYNSISGEVFWRSIPEDKYNENIHKFRVSTIQENLNNLDVTYKIIKKYKPESKLIITLSPVPLVATMRPISCITANIVSKSILRAVIDEFYRTYENDNNLFYWPSYEIVQWFGSDAYIDDNRHITDNVRNLIMEKFEKYYCI